MANLQLPEDDLESKLNASALWAVTYGDMMSYLMIFFLILFAFNVSKKAQNAPSAEKQQVEEALQEIQDVFVGKVDKERRARIEARKQQKEKEEQIEKNLQQQAVAAPGTMEVKATADRVQMVLKDAVLFDSGSAELKPEAETALAAIAQQLKDSPNEVIVEGHTDDFRIKSGKYGDNYELSMARAYSVVKFFIAHGVAPQRLSATGYGEFRPVAENQTPEGRAKNRRIEIALLRTK